MAELVQVVDSVVVFVYGSYRSPGRDVPLTPLGISSDKT